MNEKTNKKIEFEAEGSDPEVEINHALFGPPTPMGGVETSEPYEHTPKPFKIQRLKSGFFYKRNVLLTEANYHYCYIAKAFLFTISVIEGDVQRQRVLNFYLKDKEAEDMKDFLAANKVPFEIELVIRLGVPDNEQ